MTTPNATLDTAARRPGRPRQTDVDDRILAATVELLLDRESRDVTISAVVERSGAGRAAIYRRWSTREELIAAALDTLRTDPVMPDTGDLLADILSAYSVPTTTPPGYERLLRIRLVLALEDPKIQSAYWHAHVARRRVPVTEALLGGVQSGELRSDLDIDATIDLIAGVFYYQLTVRGNNLDADALVRVHSAIRIVWRGIAAG